MGCAATLSSSGGCFPGCLHQEAELQKDEKEPPRKEKCAPLQMEGRKTEAVATGNYFDGQSELTS